MMIVPYSHLRHLPPTLRLPLLLQHYRQLPLSLPLQLNRLQMKIVQCCHLQHLPPTRRLPLLLPHYPRRRLWLPLRQHLLARSRCHPLLLLLNRRLPLHRQHCETDNGEQNNKRKAVRGSIYV